MGEDDWSRELRFLENRGATLAPGMNDDELQHAEEVHRFLFPADFRALLSLALPVGEGFPDWRRPHSPDLIDQLALPFEGIAFDIENNGFWWEPWGPRPAALPDALSIARAAVDSAPRLVPIAGHRFIPAEPGTAGNPVFSVHQTDIIYYGVDLRSYLACKFDGLPYADAVRGEPPRIRFWTDLVEANG